MSKIDPNVITGPFVLGEVLKRNQKRKPKPKKLTLAQKLGIRPVKKLR